MARSRRCFPKWIKDVVKELLVDRSDEDTTEWANCLGAADNVIYEAYCKSYLKLIKIREHKLKLLQQLETGGRKRMSCHKHPCAYTMPIRQLTHIVPLG